MGLWWWTNPRSREGIGNEHEVIPRVVKGR